MDLKICRICSKTGPNFLDIFRVEGLIHKIETTLPIVVLAHTLLPDTICKECIETVENFYIFTKTCLQNLIILESQLNVKESSLKSKRKHDKSCFAKLSSSDTNKSTQTEDYLDVLLGKKSELGGGLNINFPLTTKYLKDIGKTNENSKVLVNYDIDSDETSDNEENDGKVLSGEKLITLNKLNDFVEMILNKKVNFAPQHDKLISEISQRKMNLKRKNEVVIEQSCTKICKLDLSSKRKCARPKKCEIVTQTSDDAVIPVLNDDVRNLDSTNFCDGPTAENTSQLETAPSTIPLTCLTCDICFTNTEALASHYSNIHNLEMSEALSQESTESVVVEKNDRKKKCIPNLVKISDLRRTSVGGATGILSDNQNQLFKLKDNASTTDVLPDPPSLQPTFVCPNCPAVFVSKIDLMLHLRLIHADQASYLCGLCLHQATTYGNLKNHLSSCSLRHTVTSRYICKVCYYGDDNLRWLEHHVLVHEFLLDFCRKECRIFDPADYIEKNEKFLSVNGSPFSRAMSCTDCGQGNFETFKDFSGHRRSEHSIFHCDLCNKFYGRNSHLWKHVNRLHKGHPSITCQMCYKTSASKYHLSQHFYKIHAVKAQTQQKMTDFDFSDVKNSTNNFSDVKTSTTLSADDIKSEYDSNSNTNHQLSSEDRENDDDEEEEEEEIEMKLAPKEIDSTHDLYNNIITNYTPPLNEGEFKCPKCLKSFHKRVLLKKHKKNCRPRMQKDLLTRCKSCSRIFKDRQSLAKHLINYHSDYVCEICQQKVQSKCEIVSHIRFQHDSSHLICHLCENVLRSQKDLEEHLRTHDDSFICQFCGDSLPSKVKLKMHILSLHRAILSLSCGICLRLFENQHVLRDHVTLIHKDKLDPLTSCPVCGKNYGSKWKAYDHLNKSHGRIFRACKICLEVFNTDQELEAHTKTAHVNIPPTNNISKSIGSSLVSHIASTINEVATNHLNNNNSESEEEKDSEASDSEEEDNVQITEDNEYDGGKLNPFSVFSQRTLFAQDNRISLLEKRLLGKKVSGDGLVTKVESDAGLKPKQTNDIVEIKRENPMDCKMSADVKKEENLESPLINQVVSSKRTVYVNSNDPSKCEICKKVWPAKKHLWQHYIRCHKSVAATVCGICLKSNQDYLSLQIHLRTFHPNLLYGQGFGSNFICRVCGRYHNASSKLRLHMAIHENFDWNLLETLPPLPKIAAVKPENHKIKQEALINGSNLTPKKENVVDTGFDQNYLESLIEEEEYYSHNSNSDEDEVRQSDVDTVDSSPRTATSGTKKSDNGELTQEELSSSTSSSSSESSSSTMTDKDVDEDVEGNDGSAQPVKDDSTSTKDLKDFKTNNSFSGNIFRRMPAELDSAVKSISLECSEPTLVEDENEYFDIQTNFLNDNNEIESAVGSIL